MSTAVDRKIVREIRIRSLVPIVFWLSICLWAVGGIGVVALYVVGAAAGGLGGFHGFMASLGLTGVWDNPITFIPVFALVAAIASTVAAAAGALVGLLYNALSPLVGGVEIVSRER